MDPNKDLVTVKMALPDENIDGVIGAAGIEFVSTGGGEVLISGSIWSCVVIEELVFKASAPVVLKFSKMYPQYLQDCALWSFCVSHIGHFFDEAVVVQTLS